MTDPSIPAEDAVQVSAAYKFCPSADGDIAQAEDEARETALKRVACNQLIKGVSLWDDRMTRERLTAGWLANRR
jgi:hypothetical protein